jgi:heme-degrading monooxygenase HmoA
MASPVTLINSFEVPEERVDECHALWREAAAVLKKQPGYIHTHLHRSLNGKVRLQVSRERERGCRPPI